MNCDCDPSLLLDYRDGELAAAAEADLLRHLAECPGCRQRLAALREADASLAALGSAAPPVEAAHRVQRQIRQERGIEQRREILTLEEAADFLRLPPDDLATALDDLPWFELAGKIRFRRQALLDWVRRREQECVRERLGSSLRRSLRSIA